MSVTILAAWKDLQALMTFQAMCPSLLDSYLAIFMQILLRIYYAAMSAVCHRTWYLTCMEIILLMLCFFLYQAMLEWGCHLVHLLWSTLVTPCGDIDLGQNWPSGNKPLPQPMLTQFFITMYGVTRSQWHNQSFIAKSCVGNSTSYNCTWSFIAAFSCCMIIYVGICIL